MATPIIRVHIVLKTRGHESDPECKKPLEIPERAFEDAD